MSIDDGYTVPVATLVKLGSGDAKEGRRVLRAMIDLEITREIAPGPTEKPPNVRVATRSDEDAVLELLLKDYYENASDVNTMDAGSVLTMIHSATRENTATLGVIDGPDGAILGAILVSPEKCWWTTDWNLAERVTFVHPAHRSTHYAVDLLNFAKWMADKMTDALGYRVYLTGSVTATKDAHMKCALMARHMGFMGGVFVYPALPVVHQ